MKTLQIPADIIMIDDVEITLLTYPQEVKIPSSYRPQLHKLAPLMRERTAVLKGTLNGIRLQ